MSTFFFRAVASAVASLPALAPAATLRFEQALDLAVQRSEATRSARAGVASASEAARAAGQLPDPVLRAGVDNLPATGGDRLSTTRDAMTMKRIGIGQEWVSAEKRAARQAAADAMVSRESVTVQAAAADVRLQTAFAYLDAFYAAEALKLTTLTEQHLHEEYEAARARLSSSAGSSQDVLAAARARGIAEDGSAEVRQQQSAARVALERWIGVPSDELFAPGSFSAGRSELGFVQNDPGVVAAQRDVELARQQAHVARTNGNPNWSWEVSYGQRTGYSDMVSFAVNIPLPILRAERQDRETASTLALVDKAEARMTEASRAAAAEYRALASDAQRLAERIERYQSGVVIPAEQRTAAAMAGYRSNQATLAALFDARHMEVDAQRKVLDLQRDLGRTQAQLAFKPLLPEGAR